MVPLHTRAVLQALLVTFLWSTSWVFIKVGLEEIPALTFAGLRYALAFLLLLPLAFRGEVRQSIARLTRREWLLLMALGLVMYTLTQGAQFLALERLPARIFALVGLGTYSGGAALGRYVNRSATLPALTVTIISMGVGAVLLLGSGVALQGPPVLSLRSWAIVVWLAVVNTAFAFTLWNLTLRKLTAMESSLINNTMLVQIALLAWVFLGESLGVRQVVGLLLASLGTVVVQLAGRGSPHAKSAAVYNKRRN